jgi:hypothetical protein
MTLGQKVRCIKGRHEGHEGVVTYFNPEGHDDDFCMRVDPDVGERVNPANWISADGYHKYKDEVKKSVQDVFENGYDQACNDITLALSFLPPMVKIEDVKRMIPIVQRISKEKKII